VYRLLRYLDERKAVQARGQETGYEAVSDEGIIEGHTRTSGKINKSFKGDQRREQ